MKRGVLIHSFHPRPEWWGKTKRSLRLHPRPEDGERQSIPYVCTPAQRTGLNTTTVGASDLGMGNLHHQHFGSTHVGMAIYEGWERERRQRLRLGGQSGVVIA